MSGGRDRSLLERLKIEVVVRLLGSLAREEGAATGGAGRQETDGPKSARNSDIERLKVEAGNRLLRSLAREEGLPASRIRALMPALLEMARGRDPGPDGERVSLFREMLAAQLPQEAWALLPGLEHRSTPVASTWTHQNEVMDWDIRPDERVLDVGSGGWPFARATHLADRHMAGTTHRVEPLKRDERPFIAVDLERLPFRSGAFDFVFCSHVLEHLDHPGKALRELSRVGARGYIEVPTRLSDVMLDFTRLPRHHRWHGLVLGRTLVLVEWCEWERRELGNEFFTALQSDYSNPFQAFFERNRDLFFASLQWSGGIEFLVIDRHGAIVDSSAGRAPPANG